METNKVDFERLSFALRCLDDAAREMRRVAVSQQQQMYNPYVQYGWNPYQVGLSHTTFGQQLWGQVPGVVGTQIPGVVQGAFPGIAATGTIPGYGTIPGALGLSHTTDPRFVGVGVGLQDPRLQIQDPRFIGLSHTTAPWAANPWMNVQNPWTIQNAYNTIPNAFNTIPNAYNTFGTIGLY
jgi:hypothetical protein